MADWPWLRRINPHFETIKAECEAWFRTFNAFSPKAQKAFEKCDFSLANHALNKQRLRTSCDLMMLFFIIDDPNKPRPGGEPVVGEVARQFWALGIQSATPLAQKRFLETFEDYIHSVVDQASDRDDKHIQLGMDRVDEIWNHPVIDELRRIAVDIVFLDNDIVSYKKELAAGNDNHNTVTIIMHEESTALSAAMEWVATRRKVLTSRFIAQYKKVPWDDTDAQVREYVEGIANWPRASDSWGFESGRYFGSDGLKVQKDPFGFITQSSPTLRGKNVFLQRQPAASFWGALEQSTGQW
ncbi:terpenoid synthase [Mycena sanguinolenta]|nr:terpenoid synthase [Mycena sanguinolenta]